MKDPKDWCQWPRCRSPSLVIYGGKGLCDQHWKKHCQLQEAGRAEESPASKWMKKVKLAPDEPINTPSEISLVGSPLD